MTGDGARGVIGAAVVAAARQSAGLSHRALARRAGVTVRTVRAWEDGTVPLYCVGYEELRDLGRVLAECGADVRVELADLLVASQCDVLLAGMLDGFEDYAEVPPVDEEPAGEAARELLRWALAGEVPEQYRGHVRRGALLPAADISSIMTVARGLASGESGPALAPFGTVLLALASPPPEGLPGERAAGEER
jgi:transcriptional regulator with XRE-family HTH domain